MFIGTPCIITKNEQNLFKEGSDDFWKTDFAMPHDFSKIQYLLNIFQKMIIRKRVYQVNPSCAIYLKVWLQTSLKYRKLFNKNSEKIYCTSMKLNK